MAPMTDSDAIPGPAAVSLVEITRADVRRWCALAVAPEQTRFVASVALSIAEAHFSPEAWFRGIATGGEPAGFVMLSVKPELPEYYLWRFLIDQRFQRRGIGAAALTQVIDHVRGLGAPHLELSYVPGEGSPEPFYRGFGFVPTGAVEDGEVVMRLTFGAGTDRA